MRGVKSLGGERIGANTSFACIWQLRSLRRLTVIGGLLVCAIVLSAVIAAHQLRDAALAESEREHQNLAFLLADNFGQQLDRISIELDELRNRLADDFVHQETSLQQYVSAHGQVAHVSVLDARRRVIGAGTRSPGFDFEAILEGVLDDLEQSSTSTVVKGPFFASGAWLLVLGKAYRGDGGIFLGGTVAMIDLQAWHELPNFLSLKEDERIAVLLLDGTLVLRYPDVATMLGRKLILRATGPELTDAKPQRTFRLQSPIDGNIRIGAVRKIRNFPLMVSANTTADAAVAAWSRHNLILAAAAAAGITIIGMVLFVIGRGILREYAWSEQRLEEERSKLDLALNNMAQGLLVYDASDRLRVCNQPYLDMFNLSAEVVKPGCRFRDVVRHRQETGSFDGDLDAYCSTIKRNVDAGLLSRRLVTAPNGHVVQMTTKALAGGGWIMTMEDVSELQRTHERVAHLARHDMMTDLPNRFHFRERLHEELNRLEGASTLALLLVDLDGFKIVNDTYGHNVGDALLSCVAKRLVEAAGPDNIVARLGGDEFAIIHVAGDASAAQGLAQEVLVRLQAAMMCAGHALEIDASIGIATATAAERDAEHVIKRADLALYAAKGAGRGNYRIFEPEMEIAATRKHTLEKDLRRALVERQFEVHYQPIVEMRSLRPVGYEALVRWRHPERGLIPPAEFIPLAEETHLIVDLGRLVLETACRDAANWANDAYVAINISAIQFRSETLATDVMAALQRSQLRSGRLVLELTETVFLNKEDVVLRTMQLLRARGVQIALDDFGTGYASLSYLHRFPINKIKIDRSFVGTLGRVEESEQIVQAIIAMADALGMTTTAEGVETEQQAETLIRLGCQEGQGFLFGRPTPLSKEATISAA